MKKQLYVLFTADEWLSLDSLNFQGVFSNLKDLYKAIRELIKDGAIELKESAEKLTFEIFKNDFEHYQNYLKYCYIEIAYLNELN